VREEALKEDFLEEESFIVKEYMLEGLG